MPQRPIIVVLDDDPDDVAVAVAALTNLTDRAEIKAFHRAVDLLEYLDETKACPAVVAIDYRLNDGAVGWASMKEIKRRCPTTFLIAVSGTADPVALRAFINLDGRRIIDKGSHDFANKLLLFVSDGLQRWVLMQGIAEISNKKYDE